MKLLVIVCGLGGMVALFIFLPFGQLLNALIGLAFLTLVIIGDKLIREADYVDDGEVEPKSEEKFISEKV